ncbi:MAG: hypothetical protein PHC88_01585 [Terrimicrobiaceae bacterium]|nr:hypothetical protein [Terrimicrobiaceae bacterium]
MSISNPIPAGRSAEKSPNFANFQLQSIGGALSCRRFTPMPYSDTRPSLAALTEFAARADFLNPAFA